MVGDLGRLGVNVPEPVEWESVFKKGHVTFQGERMVAVISGDIKSVKIFGRIRIA